MALPALIGLGALSSTISAIITRITIALFAKKALHISILVAVFLLMNTALDILFSYISSLVMPMLTSALGSAPSFIGSFLPSNATECITAIITCEIACVTYSLTIKSLEIQSKIVNS